MTRTSILLVLVLGTLIAAFQVYIDYADQNRRIDTRINSIIEASATPAARAIYHLDNDLAQEVVNGLKKYDFLHHISIIDDDGNIMAVHDTPIPASSTTWLTKWLKGYSTSFETALGSSSDDFRGALLLKLNNDIALNNVYHRAGYIFGVVLLLTTILALALVYTYHKLLTQPLFQIAQHFTALISKGIDKTPVPYIENHENNELGQIVDSANNLLSIIDKREKALEQSENQLRLILNASPNQVFALNKQGEFVFLNSATANFYRKTTAELEGKSFFKTHSEIDEKQAYVYFQNVECASARSGETHESDMLIKNADGSERVLHVSMVTYQIHQQRCVLIIANDITERVEAENRIERLAFFDTLTQLPNRHQIEEKLKDDIRVSKKRDTYGALLFIDIDDFKRINDTFGHSTGDALLLKLSNRMQTQIRKSETLARLGGDEFILSVPNVAEAREKTEALAANLAERLLQSIRRPLRIGEHELEVSASIGIALYPDGETGLDRLLSAGDTAMYQAKAQGRDRYLIFNSTMSDEASRLLKLESDIRKAIGDHQFIFYLQPLLDSVSREMVGAEALIRWEHPERGQVMPDQFIEYLENSPMMGKVGELMLDNVCAFIHSCHNRNIMDEHTRIAVNISAREFHQPNFVSIVMQTLEKYHLNGNCLELEITEGAALKHIEQSIEKMQLLRGCGIKFALDDFGTGYSSLSYLKELPVDKIKIDKSFIRDITFNRQDAMMVSAIIAIADTLDLEVVAEGVETEAQANWLHHHGKIQFQGYLFDKPMPKAEFETQYLKAAPPISIPSQ